MEFVGLAFMAAVVGNQLAALAKLKRFDDRLGELVVEARIGNHRQEDEADGFHGVHAQAGSCGCRAAQGGCRSARESLGGGGCDE